MKWKQWKPTVTDTTSVCVCVCLCALVSVFAHKRTSLISLGKCSPAQAGSSLADAFAWWDCGEMCVSVWKGWAVIVATVNSHWYWVLPSSLFCSLLPAFVACQCMCLSMSVTAWEQCPDLYSNSSVCAGVPGWGSLNRSQQIISSMSYEYLVTLIQSGCVS